MSKVLYVKANPKSVEESRTFQMSEAFIETYKEQHPNDEIIVLDLYKEDIKPMNGEMVKNLGTGKFTKYAQQFADADKYIIAAPMWNLGTPAILKAYFDYITVPGIVFKYTADGSIGLLENKKAVHITARGGMYSQGPGADWEMGNRYIRTLLGFFGIEEINTIAFELADVLQGDEYKYALNNSIENARKLAKVF